MNESRDQRGVALPLVLAVLVCLISVAIPFALSMRHEQGGVAFRVGDDEARRSALAVRDLALTHMGETAPDRDETPWSDAADEMTIDVEATARLLGIEDLGPRGRLLSAAIEDQSGRIDLNAANLFLVARLLGMATTLSSKLTPEDKQVRLADGDFLQDSGFLWIDGEITYYARKEGSSVFDLRRPAVVPGVWMPATMNLEPREHDAGTDVLDFRAWMVANWLYKAVQGQESRFDTPLHALAIERLGQGALSVEARARLEQFATVDALDGNRARFGNPQRVLSEITSGTSSELRIGQGQFAGRGTLAKVTAFGGRSDYGIVLRSSQRDDGASLQLEMPLLIDAAAGQAQVEFLLPHAVNINSASRETLVLLMEGLKLRGATREVNRAAAERVAERIERARPLPGMRELITLLDSMVEREKNLEGEQRLAILLNAEHSGCYDLEYGTAPFCYASDGLVEVRTAASLNFELNGRERARAFVREMVATAGAGRSVRLFKTQRDFDEPWRLNRMARGWTTAPENLNFFSGGLGAADPPTRLLAMSAPRSRFPSEEVTDSGARLVTAWYDLQAVNFDRTWHFDGRRGDIVSTDAEGWRLSEGPQSFKPDGSNPGVAISQNVSGVERPRPFGVSMWWNPGRDLGGEQTLFDWKCNAQASNPDLSDRVRLRFVKSRLEFEVNDAFLRASQDDLYTSKLVYDFTDGLVLEADTWYHVTAFCRGNRAGQMALFVDGKPRGKWSHYTRLSGSFTASTQGTARIPVDVKRLADGTAKFPPRGAVRVGNEVVEYSAVSGSTFTVSRDDKNHFGGLRPALSLQQQSGSGGGGATGVSHPSSEGVELYGYSARLVTDVPAGSATLGADGLPAWGVAKVASSMAQVQIEMDVQQRGGGGGGPPQPINLGRGFDADVNAIGVSALDGGKLPADGPLSKGGGYAALIGYYFGTLTPRDDQNNQAGQLDSFKTTTKSWVNGVEIIHYGGFDGTQLTNVRRGQVVAAELANTDLGEFSATAAPNTNTVFHFCERHAFVVAPNKRVFADYVPAEFTTLVVPLSVVVTGNVKTALLVPEQVTGAEDRCEMAQIGSPSGDGVFDPTEWIRYDSIVQDQNGAMNLLRSDAKRLFAAEQVACGFNRPSGRSDTWDPSLNTTDYLYAIAASPGNFKLGQSAYDDFVEALNQENLLGGDPDMRLGNSPPHALAFRGVLDTGAKDKKHGSGESVYPVFRVARSGPKPGRYDEITIVGAFNERPERHFLNYAWSQDSAEDWAGECHVALLAESAATRFVVPPSLGIANTNATNIVANLTFSSDSRNFARILKFPSGELPSRWDGASELTVGGSAGGGGGGGDGAKVDEVRIFAAEDPQPIFAHGMHVLNREIAATESDRFEIADDLLRFPHDQFGQIGATVSLHQDACVWQFGDEFIIGGERNLGQPVVQQIAADGRLRFGGDTGYHGPGETGYVLPWLVMTRLAGGMSTSDEQIALTDPAGFPPHGCVMIDQEVLAYSGRAGNGGPASLYVPTYLDDPTGRSSRTTGDAAFRGRYGTPVMTHAADSVVFFWPYRYADGYQDRCEIPELATLELQVAARRGLYHALTWSESKGDPLARLIATVRVQGRGNFAGDPALDPDLFVFDSPGTREKPNLLDRQGDLLRVRFNVDYREGAFDPVEFARNSWKRAPLLEAVAVEYLADRVVLRHEESR